MNNIISYVCVKIYVFTDQVGKIMESLNIKKKIWNHFVMCISKKNTDTSLKMQVILPLKGKVLTDIIELSGLIERKHGLKKRVVN